jgi:hypothetical protein
MSEDPQPKLAKNMTPQERASALAILKRGPAPEPMPTDRKAQDMTEQERAEWLREHKRRFG